MTLTSIGNLERHSVAMRKPNATADVHQRIRRDHASEIAEDYVRAIHRFALANGKCRVVDLAQEFGVSHVTVTRTIARLKRIQLVASQPYGPVTLTVRGYALAAKSHRQLSVVYEFLRAIGVTDETASMDAEGIEHHVSSETLERVDWLTKLLADKGLRCDRPVIMSFGPQDLRTLDRRNRQTA